MNLCSRIARQSGLVLPSPATPLVKLPAEQSIHPSTCYEKRPPGCSSGFYPDMKFLLFTHQSIAGPCSLLPKCSVMASISACSSPFRLVVVVRSRSHPLQLLLIPPCAATFSLTLGSSDLDTPVPERQMFLPCHTSPSRETLE